MVVRADGTVDDRHFNELSQFLRSGDLLVLNETRVIAARLHGARAGSGGRVELLLLHPADSQRYRADALRWIALARPAKRLRTGERVIFERCGGATITRELPDGAREIELQLEVPFETFLERAGSVPLPPYIHNESPEAAQRYQTVFARVPGSVAAPTASLHFTTQLLDRLEAIGVQLVRITLDVGLGTFRPISAEQIEGHVMHAEAYAISPQAAALVDAARNDGRRIVAAGTTVVRALEGNRLAHGRIVSGEHVTNLFITPGFRFAVVDAMITNFHLPRSSLLVLVSAFAGRERILAAYRRAVELRYRFFSFGDAMFIERPS